MNIKTPFKLIGLNKKDIIHKLKENNIKYKVEDYFLKYYQKIDELNLICEVSIYCVFKKINSISYSYIFDKSLDKDLIFKRIEEIKDIYKNQFEVESYFDPKDGKTFVYRLCYENFSLYLHGSSYCSKEIERHIGITYGRESKYVATTKNRAQKKLEIKHKYIKRLDKYVNNNDLDNWYGLLLSVRNSKGISSTARVDVLEDKLIIYFHSSCKIRSFEIDFNKIKRYDLYEDFVHISYEDKKFLFTIIKNDVSIFNNIICDKIGYSSDKYKTLNQMVSEAFNEYDVFNNSSLKKERNKRYINETTKVLFKTNDLTSDIMYNILQGIDFDMYFYFEWKNFSDYLYNKLKEQNYF